MFARFHPRSNRLNPDIVVALFAVVLFGVSASVPDATGFSPPASGIIPSAPVVTRESSPDDFRTTTNGNFSIWIGQPTVAPVPGSYIEAQFTVSLTGGPPSPGTVAVWVPQTEATFALSNGSIRMFDPPFELNFSEGGPTVSAPQNIIALVKFNEPFNASALAILSSQLSALMTNLPYGSVHLSVSWRWIVAYPDGSTVVGPWSPATSLVPAEYAQLVSYGPSTVNPGGWFGVCVAGPIAGRQFSLHLETANPYDDFEQVNQSVPANSSAPICWTGQVASWVTPQVILAHVWNYDQVTLLLYIIKVSVVNQTSSFLQLPAYWTGWTGATTLGAACVGLALAGWSVRRWLGHKPT